MSKWLAALLAALALVPEARAATCTDGTDCYCDCVNGPDSGSPAGYKNAACQTKAVPVDAAWHWCEDYEAVTLHDGNGTGSQGQTGPGSGGTACVEGNASANCYGNASGPLWGPWYDPSGSGGFSGTNRGVNSYWARTYQGANIACLYIQTQPTSPTLGATCGVPPEYQGCTQAEYSPIAANNAPEIQGCIDIFQNGEFDDEDPTNAAPLIPGGGSGVFDGANSFGARVPPGNNSSSGSDTAGIMGGVDLPNMTEIGITEAWAYPDDIASTGIFGGSWKDNEWGYSSTTSEFWFRGVSSGRLRDNEIPYHVYRNSTGGDCFAAIASAVEVVGQVYCSSQFGVMYIHPDESEYIQATDAPFGTWACTRAYQVGVGTTNNIIKIWNNSDLIVHITNIDGTQLEIQDYRRVAINDYSNFNQENGQATTKVTYRYGDNWHIRAGVPVSCEQIGFNFAGGWGPGGPGDGV